MYTYQSNLEHSESYLGPFGKITFLLVPPLLECFAVFPFLICRANDIEDEVCKGMVLLINWTPDDVEEDLDKLHQDTGQ